VSSASERASRTHCAKYIARLLLRGMTFDAAERKADETVTVFTVHLRATRSDDSIRGLRWLLKAAWRRYGLKAVTVREEVIERRRRAA
jgi:hypothetical protein